MVSSPIPKQIAVPQTRAAEHIPPATTLGGPRLRPRSASCSFSSLSRVLLALTALLLVFVAPASLRAATMVAGNVTTALGPTFFLDDASNGGSDTDINQNPIFPLASGPSYVRDFSGLLTSNQGPTQVVLTGFGFATHTSATANDATSLTVTFTYLGADGALGGGDDIVVGAVTAGFVFTASASNPNAEYVLAFDSPLSANLTITGTKFSIQITPTNATNNGSLKLKSATAFQPKLSVAGVVSPVINPQRVNLAKFQNATASNSATQRLATYLNDGVAGNDNRWQGNSNTYNWAQVDFPFPVDVGSAHVFSGVDDTFPISNYSIQYLSGGIWVTIPGASVSGNTNVERNLVFTNTVKATSFRLLGQDASLRVRELALFPPNGSSGYPLGTDVNLNLAYQRPVVASANSTGNFPLYAVDGRSSAFMWQTTTAGVNTLDIDMRVTSKIGSVHLYSGSTGVAPLGSFVLKSWSGTAWVNIPGGTIAGNTTADLIVAFTTPVTTSQVRLEFTNPGTSSIRELCVFPANTGNVGYAIGTNIIGSGKYADYEDFNDAYYRITNPASSRFITVANSGQPALDQAGLTTAQGQYQVLLNLSNGTYRLRNRDTGDCLSGAQLSKTPGDALTDVPYVAMPQQDWILNPLGGGAFQIVNVWSGLAVDTQAGATAQGTLLVQNTASSATTQRWRFTNSIPYPKKGIGGTSIANRFIPSWAYNWGQKYAETLPSVTVYNPMQWGDYNWDIGSNAGPLWQYYPTWRKRDDGIFLLGFNEPDGFGQSGRDLDPNNPATEALFSATRAVDETVRLWPRLQSLDLPLLSIAPANPTWLTNFYAGVDSLGYRVDATAIHAYPSPGSGSSDGLFSSVSSAYTAGGNRPVWLTEFSFVDWAANQSWSEEDNYNCLAEFIWRAESVPELRKYSLFVFTEDANNPQPANPWQNFTPAPRSNSIDISGNLTAFGKLYAAWDNDANVRSNKTYYIHNKSTRKRLANMLGAVPRGHTIRIDGQSVDWTLAATPTSGRYYVVSSRDGHRLSSASGAAPTLAAEGTTGANVEWSLTATQYGWYYLVHTASSKRLQLSFNDTSSAATYTMVANTTTGDAVEWRFIAPQVSADTAPVLASITPKSVNEGALLTFTASATDADVPADTLTYSLIGAPTGAAINPTTGVFTWTPTESQGPATFNFNILVSDGDLTHDQPVTVTVNEVNVAPVLASITGKTVNEGVQLTFTASATDSDLPANTLTYSLISAPTGASIIASTGVFTWTPTEAQGPGTYNFTVRVSDGSLTNDRSVAVTVNEINTAPALATIPSQIVNEGALLTFTASATDADLPANTLTYSLVSAPTGATINSSTGVFTWTPSEAQGPGSFNFTVRVSDGSLTNDRSVAVTVNEVNTAPVLAAISAQTVNEGVQLTFTASANDSDLPANTLTYSLISAPTGATINSSTGAFTWTPTEAQGPGNFTFSVQVSDGSLSASQLVSVTVNEVNTAPVLATIAPQTVNEEVLLSFASSATDTDLPTNTLTYSLVSAPTGATIDPNTGAFTWTPTEAQGPGTFNFTVRVSDGTLTDDKPVSVTVNEVNIAPVLAAIAPQTVNQDALLSFTVTATDVDILANTLTYTLISAPTGAVIASSTGVFTWTPTGTQGIGSYDFTVQVSDGSLTNTKPVTVTVTNPYPSATVDSDGDGLSDLLEFAFQTNLAIPNGSPFRILSVNANNTVTLEFPWNWQATGLSWQIHYGRDLANTQAWPVVNPGTTTTMREGNIDRTTVNPIMTFPEGGFYILKVNVNL